MLPSEIKSAADLVTTREETCAGFLNQALAKTQKAHPYIGEAIKFWNALKTKNSLEEMVKDSLLRSHLIAAAGFSDKAKNYFSNDELTEALKKMFAVSTDEDEKPETEKFKIDVFSRYLLTKGDSLGGEMRNVTGAVAGRKLAAAIIEALASQEIQHHITKDEISGKVQQISWKNRRMVFDVKSPLVEKNIDVILLNSKSHSMEKSAMLKNADLHLALGELKGGIDPAGADEHWKTARTTLERIRQKFGVKCPPLFFVGAAVANAMSFEIFEDLNSGRLAHAANLTHPKQLSTLAVWLVNL